MQYQEPPTVLAGNEPRHAVLGLKSLGNRREMLSEAGVHRKRKPGNSEGAQSEAVTDAFSMIVPR
jgi:hypothetical protein